MIARLYCWLVGHDSISLYTINTEYSCWGEHKCLRCGRTEAWQYDKCIIR